MIRIVRLSHQYYGLDMGNRDITDPEGFIEEITNFVDSADPVLLVNAVEDIEHIIPGFDLDNLIMVDKNDDEE